MTAACNMSVAPVHCRQRHKTASGEGYEPRFVYPNCLVFTVFGCETQFVIMMEHVQCTTWNLSLPTSSSLYR